MASPYVEEAARHAANIPSGRVRPRLIEVYSPPPARNRRWRTALYWTAVWIAAVGLSCVGLIVIDVLWIAAGEP